MLLSWNKHHTSHALSLSALSFPCLLRKFICLLSPSSQIWTLPSSPRFCWHIVKLVWMRFRLIVKVSKQFWWVFDSSRCHGCCCCKFCDISRCCLNSPENSRSHTYWIDFNDKLKKTHSKILCTWFIDMKKLQTRSDAIEIVKKLQSIRQSFWRSIK